MVSIRDLIDLREAPIGATSAVMPSPAARPVARAATPPGRAAAQSGGSTPFDPKDYLRQLRQSSVDVQRLRNAESPEAASQRKIALLDLARLFRQGTEQVRTAIPAPLQAQFIDQIQKIVSAAGVSIPAAAAPAPDAAKMPGRDPGVAGDPNDKAQIFRDRLPRFMHKWNENDAQWRLLQSASINRNGKIYVAGIAEMRGPRYVFFHGENGGQYDPPQTMSLADARSRMSRALAAGYTEIPAGMLASKVGLAHVANQQPYRMDQRGQPGTAAPQPAPHPSQQSSPRRYAGGPS